MLSWDEFDKEDGEVAVKGANAGHATEANMDRTMIPLGSCTMKLNAASEMIHGFQVDRRIFTNRCVRAATGFVTDVAHPGQQHPGCQHKGGNHGPVEIAIGNTGNRCQRCAAQQYRGHHAQQPFDRGVFTES